MNKFQEAYRSKKINHQELIGLLKPGTSLVFSTWLAQPVGIMRALGQYGKEIDPLYVTVAYTTGPPEYLSHPGIHCYSAFLGPHERTARKQRRNVSFLPLQYTDGRKWVRETPASDWYMVRTAAMDDRGYFNMSLASSWEYDALHWISKNVPEARIVFEVNHRMPRLCGLEQFGNNEFHISEVDYVVEDDTPLFNYHVPAASATEHAIAGHVAQLVEDRATVQLGLGSLPMVIGKLLADRKELGIHSEMFCQAHADLVEAGCVSNAHKGVYDGISVATLALGDDKLYRWLHENRTVAILPVEAINAVPVLSRIRQLVSINSVLTVDLSGQACAHCLGPQTYSGLGGAFEFAYGSQLSPGGKSILCLHSTALLADGRAVSNIVARHPSGTRITIPEHCVDWVATEFGAVRLKFLPMEWRAAALIAIAHPDYREELTKQAEAQGLAIPRLAKQRPPAADFFVGVTL